LLGALILAVSPDLHKAIHRDADHGDHQCLVTILCNGGCPPDAAPILVVVPLPEVREAPIVEIRSAESLLARGVLHQRGPPAGFGFA